MANRRMLLKAIETVQAGGTAPGVADAALAAQMHGPDTVDGIAPAGTWADLVAASRCRPSAPARPGCASARTGAEAQAA